MASLAALIPKTRLDHIRFAELLRRNDYGSMPPRNSCTDSRPRQRPARERSALQPEHR